MKRPRVEQQEEEIQPKQQRINDEYLDELKWSALHIIFLQDCSVALFDIEKFDNEGFRVVSKQENMKSVLCNTKLGTTLSGCLAERLFQRDRALSALPVRRRHLTIYAVLSTDSTRKNFQRDISTFRPVTKRDENVYILYRNKLLNYDEKSDKIIIRSIDNEPPKMYDTGRIAERTHCDRQWSNVSLKLALHDSELFGFDVPTWRYMNLALKLIYVPLITIPFDVYGNGGKGMDKYDI